MCFKTKKTSTTSTNQTQGPEQWVRDEGSSVYGTAKDLVNTSEYAPASGVSIDNANTDWQAARDKVGGMAGTTNADYDKASGIFDSVAAADDPKKSVEDYMNPYLASVLGPTIRKMMESGQIARNQIGSQAAMSGAFGDARQGVLEARQYQDENQNIGDTTANLYKSGWDNATQQRNAVLQRLLSAGGATQNLGTARDTRTTNIAQMLASLSDKERSVGQAESDRSRKYPFEEATWLMSMLNQTPALTNSSGTSTSTEKGTDNSGFQLLGKILGSVGSALIP